MKTNEQTEKQAVPVMKQLARSMSPEELAVVAGGPDGCAPGATSIRPAPDDELN
jgi:hypothetical protein